VCCALFGGEYFPAVLEERVQVLLVEETLGHTTYEVEVVFDGLFFCGAVMGVPCGVEAGEQVATGLEAATDVGQDLCGLLPGEVV
jgi:hypothetical protein